MDTTPNDEGQELYNANGVRIVGKTVDENSLKCGEQQFYFTSKTPQVRMSE